MGQKRAMAGSTDGQAGNLHDAGGWAIRPTSKNCKKKAKNDNIFASFG